MAPDDRDMQPQGAQVRQDLPHVPLESSGSLRSWTFNTDAARRPQRGKMIPSSALPKPTAARSRGSEPIIRVGLVMAWIIQMKCVRIRPLRQRQIVTEPLSWDHIEQRAQRFEHRRQVHHMRGNP